MPSALALIASVAFASVPSPAQDRAPEPCVTPSWPTAGPLAAAPAIVTWRSEQPPRDWVLPSCAGWTAGRFQSLAAVVGEVAATNVGAIAARIGAIAEYKGMRYWSTTDSVVEVLIRDASAVESLNDRSRRADFTLADMQAGHDLFFLEEDNRSGSPILYRMSIVAYSSEQLVVDIQNVDKVRKLFVTLFEPGDLRTTLFVWRTNEGFWELYALSGLRPRAFAGLFAGDKSQTNRLIALYAHSLGLDETGLPWKR